MFALCLQNKMHTFQEMISRDLNARIPGKNIPGISSFEFFDLHTTTTIGAAALFCDQSANIALSKSVNYEHNSQT